MRLMRVYQIGVLLCGLLCPMVALSQVLSVTPSIEVGGRYDDNIFQRQDKTDDFITVITPGIILRYAPSRETQFDFDYRPSFEFFAEETDENQVSHRLSLSLDAALSRRVELTLSNNLRITQEPSDREREVIRDDGTREISDEEREQTIRNIAEAALRFQLAPRSSIRLLFESLIEDVDDPDEDDEFTYALGTEFGYLTNIQRLNRFLLGFVAEIFTFEANDEDSLVNTDDFIAYTAWVGYEHHFNPTLTVTARVGPTFSTGIDSDTDTGDDTRVAGQINLEKELRTGSVSVGYERRFGSGGGRGGRVVSDRVVTQISTNLSPKVTAALNGNVVLLDYQDRIDEEDRIFFTIRPSLNYQILRTLRLSTSYIFARTLFDDAEMETLNEPDRTDHRVRFEARLELRPGLSVALSYAYRDRSFSGGGSENTREDDEFNRHRVFLSLIYGPTFRF